MHSNSWVSGHSLFRWRCLQCSTGGCIWCTSDCTKCMVHWTKIWRGWCRVAGANGARAMALGAFQWLPPPSAPMACNSHPLSTRPMKKMTKKKNKIQIQKQNTNANTKYNVIHLPRATDRWSPEVKSWLGVKSKEGRVCVDYKIQRQRQRQRKGVCVLTTKYKYKDKSVTRKQLF